MPINLQFQSTLSMRRATAATIADTAVSPISIHALHEESDHGVSGASSPLNGFQSTLSMRRATFSGR